MNWFFPKAYCIKPMFSIVPAIGVLATFEPALSLTSTFSVSLSSENKVSQSSIGPLKNCGPPVHMFHLSFCETRHGRVPISAGFKLVGIYLGGFPWVFLRIKSTLFLSKMRSSRSLLVHQLTTV